jgi:microcystin-dependent protein
MRKLSIFISAQLSILLLLGGILAVQAQATDYTTRIPVGTIQMYAGEAYPDISTGWIPADGREVEVDDFPELFLAIGCYYGGDCATTFNVPNLIGRVPVMAGLDVGSGLTERIFGESFGEEFHTLTVGELPAHSHGITDPGHIHSITDPGHTHRVPKESATINAGVNVAQPAARNDNPAAPHITTNSSTTGITINSATTGITADNTGGDEAFPMWQPSLALNFMIWGGFPSDPAGDIVITVVVVFPTHTPTPTLTPTLTPTTGPSPTPTATASPTGAPGNVTSYTVGGQEVVMDYTVYPGDAFIGGTLFFIAGLFLICMIWYVKRKTA